MEKLFWIVVAVLVGLLPWPKHRLSTWDARQLRYTLGTNAPDPLWGIRTYSDGRMQWPPNQYYVFVAPGEGPQIISLTEKVVVGPGTYTIPARAVIEMADLSCGPTGDA